MKGLDVLNRWSRLNHPFPLLLYLEWILLGVAALMAFSPPFLPPRPRRWWAAQAGWDGDTFPLGVMLCIGAIGLLGLRLPMGQSSTRKGLFTALGFGLCWLSVGLGGVERNSLPALLLVVVVRGCLLFPWRGRWAIAGLAFGSFVLKLWLGIYHFFELPDLPRPRLGTRPFRQLSIEQIQTAVLNLSLNVTLLFGLVLVFVLLMVGAILTERQSRDRLSLANDRLRRYALLIENQSALQERNRIAREIHDSVGHALTAQSIQLENVALWLPQNVPKATEHLQKSRTLGAEALQNVRQSVAKLRQPPLQGQSLTEALKTLVTNFEQTTGISVELNLHITPQLPMETAIALYRITQEAMTNWVKHGQATQGYLSLTESTTVITLLLEDNGQGFDPTQNTTGFGLQSMRERTEALGGSFKLESQPGQGCRIAIALPQSGGVL